MKLRPIKIDGDVAYVTLTRGYVAVISAEDAEDVGRYNWYVGVDAYTQYAHRKIRKSNGKQSSLSLHRHLMKPPEGFIVDHINHDGLDNRRSNLRVCTHSENNYNRRVGSNNTSGYKGVTFDKKSGRWLAQITVEGEKVNLGLHETPEEAHRVYCQASEDNHGYNGFTG